MLWFFETAPLLILSDSCIIVDLDLMKLIRIQNTRLISTDLRSQAILYCPVNYNTCFANSTLLQVM